MTDTEQLVHDAAALSSGTIAGLTGLGKYTDVERVQGDFVEFCQTAKPGQYRNWQEAWRAFEEECR